MTCDRCGHSPVEIRSPNDPYDELDVGCTGCGAGVENSRVCRSTYRTPEEQVIAAAKWAAAHEEAGNL